MRNQKMSGIKDWFKKKTESRSLIPSEERGIIYVGPAGGAKTQLPALPSEKNKRMSLREMLLSPFEVFSKGESRLPALAKKLDILPDEIKASPQELTAEQENAQKGVWADMFQPSEDQPGSMMDIFGEELPEKIVAAPATKFERIAPRKQEHEDWPLGKPPRYWTTKWRIPDPFQVAWELQNSPKWDLPGLFEFTLLNTDYPGWKKEVRESAHIGEPATLEIDQVAHWTSAYEDLIKLLDIPPNVVDKYFDNISSEDEAAERGMEFELEVLKPYLDNISRALDALRPPELRGYYEIAPADDLSWWMTYKEGMSYGGL